MNCPDDEDFLRERIYYLVDDFSLKTAYHTSQVCSSWRAVMLSSPSIWAHILKVDSLSRSNDNWTSEVLKRTKNSPISIYGSLTPHGKSIDLFFSILKDSWHRLHRVAFILEASTRDGLSDPRWMLLNKHTPNIQIFMAHADVPQVRSQKSMSLSLGKLFGNSDPRLHTLCTEDIGMDLSAPSSFASMRHLELERCDIHPDILHVLAQIKSLEFLYLASQDMNDTSDIYGDIWDTFPHIELPNLRIMDLAAKLSTISALLCHILPPKQCVLILSVNRTPNNISHTELYHIRHGFTTYYQSFQQSNILAITASSSFLYIANRIASPTDEFEPYEDVMFDFGFSRWSGILIHWDFITDAFLMPISSKDLSSVTAIALELEFQQSILLADINLATLLYALVAIETLVCSSRMIELITLIESRNDTRTIFPCLHTIILECETETQLSSIAIMRFIVQRRKTASPIRCIDLRNCKALNQEELLLLEGQKDLQVLWGAEMQKLVNDL